MYYIHILYSSYRRCMRLCVCVCIYVRGTGVQVAEYSGT